MLLSLVIGLVVNRVYLRSHSVISIDFVLGHLFVKLGLTDLLRRLVFDLLFESLQILHCHFFRQLMFTLLIYKHLLLKVGLFLKLGHMSHRPYQLPFLYLLFKISHVELCVLKTFDVLSVRLRIFYQLATLFVWVFTPGAGLYC